MNIIVNEDVISRFKAEGISSINIGNTLIILLALYNKDYVILDELDDQNKNKDILLLYQQLLRKDFLESSELENSLYILTEKSIELIKFVETQGFQNNTLISTDLIVREKVTISEKPEDWIEDWVGLFPAEKVNNRYLRISPKLCLDRMKWFIKEFKYDKSVIFESTKRYLNHQQNSKEGHLYTRTCNYFIFKGRNQLERTSDLANWCDRYVKGELEEKQYLDFNRDAV